MSAMCSDDNGVRGRDGIGGTAIRYPQGQHQVERKGTDNCNCYRRPLFMLLPCVNHG